MNYERVMKLYRPIDEVPEEHKETAAMFVSVYDGVLRIGGTGYRLDRVSYGFLERDIRNSLARLIDAAVRDAEERKGR